jgi:microcystin-dependent protein
MTRRKLAIVLPLAFLIAASAGAAPPVPHQFTSGTPARAAEVNANFEFVMERTVPTGTILPYAGATAPPGFLLCNGAAVSRTTYAALFAVVAESFGRGDGANTFNVPDLRGTFARGAVGVPNQTFLPAAVNPAIETVTVTGHGLNRTGFPVRFTTTGTLPGGLVAGTTYFAIVVDENSFMVASTYALALAGTATDLTSQGTGTHTLAQAADPDAAARVASAPGG